jgi:choline transport protein
MEHNEDKSVEFTEIDSDKRQESVTAGELINASGHVQEVDRNFGLLSLTGFGLVNGNVWPALGGTILLAIFNGGPPGTIYELYGCGLVISLA